MHKVFFIVPFFLFLYLSSNAQTTYSLHLVEFINKNNSPYSIYRPQDFLSAKALERREIQGIAIDQLDLPISPDYVEQITQLGVHIQSQSKWLNAVAIHTQDEAILAQIRLLPFVKSVQALGKFRNAKPGKFYTKRPAIDSSNHQPNYYGLADNQISMLNGKVLHQLGFTGKGVHLAVVDGGFQNVYRMPVFDSMYLNNRLLGTKDFVDGDDFVYESSTHGTSVLSTMTAKRPNLIVGTAPDASYYLFKTEDVRGEYQAEEFYWIVAMEYADSIGVDVVNSSLGYNRFRDKNMSYRYEQLDGQTALITRGANIAVSRGLFIVNAAGNDGDEDWHYLFAPADATGVFSVAAVDESGKRTAFSSWGPTADQRLKPDIAAQGGKTAYASMIKYDVGYGDGTSYACPVLTGMVASLKQAFPTTNNEVIKDAIRNSGHQAHQPDSSLGYGIPNFFRAYLSLLDSSVFIHKNGTIEHTQKTIQNDMHIYVEVGETGQLKLQVFDLWGNELYHEKMALRPDVFNKFSISDLDEYQPGVYVLKITLNQKTYWTELVK